MTQFASKKKMSRFLKRAQTQPLLVLAGRTQAKGGEERLLGAAEE